MRDEIQNIEQLKQLAASIHARADWANLVETHKSAIEEACLIRSVEQGFISAFSQGNMNGTVHTCVGQEFSATSIGACLTEGDWITSNHRCHGHFIAKTKNWHGLVDELLGKEDGICKGIGSSQHLFCPGFISNGPQGALLPVGTGIARTAKRTKNVVVSFIGEGTLGEGITYEALNLASLLGLPQVFVCENNFYSQSTRQSNNTAGSIKDRFKAFGLKTFLVNTWDVAQLYTTVAEAIAFARENQQPAAIVMYTYRLNAHSKGDDDRDPAEVSFFAEHDLLNVIKKNSNSMGQVFDKIGENTQAYFDEALKKPELKLEDYLGDQLPRNVSARYNECKGFEGRVIQRINTFLENQAANGTLILGEDIADPYGGAFKATKGISDQHPDQVVSTPISEAGLVGIAAGTCLAGNKAIAEIMFGDFVTYAFDQIVNGISKYHHMYGKQVSCPVMIRMPMGGKRGYGPTHSQSLEKFLVGIDNVLTVALTSLMDPNEVLEECRATGAPTIIIENKTDYGRRAPLLNENLKIERNSSTLGHLLVSPRYNKSHFSIITYGEPARLVVDNYKTIQSQTDSIFDVFCILKLHPLDLEQVFRRVAKQEGVLLIEDGSASFGICAEIASQLVEMGYKGKIARLGARGVPIPSQKSLEEACLIGPDRIATAVLELLDG